MTWTPDATRYQLLCRCVRKLGLMLSRDEDISDECVAMELEFRGVACFDPGRLRTHAEQWCIGFLAGQASKDDGDATE